MTKLWLVDCVNCGKQVEISGPEDICYWCHMSASKKEVIMVQKEGIVEERVVPPKPKKRRKHWEYFDQNREGIVADYHSMRLIDFFKKWAMTSNTWLRLKKKWGVENKGKGRSKPAKRTEYKKPQPRPGEFCILITEEDLAKLDDDDFRLQWVILGRIIKNRLADKNHA